MLLVRSAASVLMTCPSTDWVARGLGQPPVRSSQPTLLRPAARICMGHASHTRLLLARARPDLHGVMGASARRDGGGRVYELTRCRAVTNDRERNSRSFVGEEGAT